MIALFAEQVGYSAEELHDALKRRFLSLDSPDAPLVRVRSTTDLDTGEFERYLEECRMLAASLCGLVIPLPNEVVT